MTLPQLLTPRASDPDEWRQREGFPEVPESSTSEASWEQIFAGPFFEAEDILFWKGSLPSLFSSIRPGFQKLMHKSSFIKWLLHWPGGPAKFSGCFRSVASPVPFGSLHALPRGLGGFAARTIQWINFAIFRGQRAVGNS